MSLGRLLLKTPLSNHTGYGRDGIGLTLALSQLGYDVHLRPMTVAAPLPPEVAALLCKTPDAPYDYLIHHTDPDQLGLKGQETAIAPVRVAWSMWEFLGTDTMEHKDTLAERMAGYTKAMFYDEVSRESLSPFAPDGVPVEKLQGGYWSQDWVPERDTREWTGTFRYGMLGQLHARKDPWLAIAAFNELKSEHGDDFDAELHLKTSIPTLPPKLPFPGVYVHAEMWPQQAVMEFYMQLHLLLAPSWGEGKNLPALEAQTTGCPVAATNFGGMAEWLSKDWAYPLGYTLEEHEPGMKSARVDKEELKAVMWSAYTDRGTAREKGQRASNIIPTMLDWGQVAERLRVRLLH